MTAPSERTRIRNRPVATALAITQSIHADGRCLHFATDRGPVVVRIPDEELLRMFGEMLLDEANEWGEEE